MVRQPVEHGRGLRVVGDRPAVEQAGEHVLDERGPGEQHPPAGVQADLEVVVAAGDDAQARGQLRQVEVGHVRGR